MGATPDFPARTLVLDVTLYQDDPSFERWVFHHEFFHMLDFALDELLRSDDEWSRLNPSGFTYGSGGDRVWHDPETAYSTNSPPTGFVTQYATMGAEEDKAEIFAFMMTSPHGSSHPDPMVIRKARFLQSRIASGCAE
jgi:hypothetical protein